MGLSGYPASRHAYVDKTTIVMPDGVNLGTENRD